MPLTSVVSGNQIKATDLNQLVNVLTGVMTDQPATIANTLTATAVKASGLITGAGGVGSASRYIGATAGGAPTAGTYAIGDFLVDQTGSFWICTVAGTPGTWKQAGAVDQTSGDIKALGAAASWGTLALPAAADHVHPYTGLAVLGLSNTFSAGGQIINPAAAPTNFLDMQVAGASKARFDGSGNLIFGNANPSIQASSYTQFPGGIYVSGGTLYVQNSLAARGGISNDSGTILNIGGGTNGWTQFTGTSPVIGIGMTPNSGWAPLQIQGGAVDQNTKTTPNIRMGVASAVGSEAIVLLDSGTGNAYWIGNNGGSRFRVGIAGAELFAVYNDAHSFASGGVQTAGSRWATGADNGGNAGTSTNSNRLSGSYGGGGASSVDLPVSGSGAGYTMQGSPGAAGSTATMGVENPTASTVRIRYGISMGGAWATQWTL